VRSHSALIDGEICCLNPDGTSNFENLLFRLEWSFFIAFDLLPMANTSAFAGQHTCSAGTRVSGIAG